jgi:hypothetical protein
MRAAFLASAVLAFLLVPASPAAANACSGLPSDFDGDGRADLAVAAPYTKVGGHARAGSVTVLYGMRTDRQLTLLRGATKKGAYPGVRPDTAKTLATGTKHTLFGYALTGSSVSR